MRKTIMYISWGVMWWLLFSTFSGFTAFILFYVWIFYTFALDWFLDSFKIEEIT